MHLAVVDPLGDSLGGELALLRKLVQVLQLLLKHLDVVALVADLDLAFVEVGLEHVLVAELLAHVGLGAPPLAACFEDVDASSLGGCLQKRAALAKRRCCAGSSTYC